MKVLLRNLIDYAWVLYIVCGIGIIGYVIRALLAHRERDQALFTLERETAHHRVVFSWITAFVFALVGFLIFFSTTFILPDLPILAHSPLETPTPAAGLDPSTINPTPSPTPTIRLMPTSTPTPEGGVPTPTPFFTPTPTPTETPEAATSGSIGVAFGNFARLLSYQVPSAEVTAGGPLVLTLRWEALSEPSPSNYQVFTHLLVNNRIIAQHDSEPANGTQPLSQWSPGDIVVDVHQMSFRDSTYTGPAELSVGFYDQATGQRVMTENGTDRIVLPVTITVVSE